MTDAICDSLASRGVAAEIVTDVRGVLLTTQEFEGQLSDACEDAEARFSVQRAAIAFRPAQLAQTSLAGFFSQDMDALLSLSQACGLITVPSRELRACDEKLVTAFLKHHATVPGGLEPHQLCLDDLNLGFGEPYEAFSGVPADESCEGPAKDREDGPELLPGVCLDVSASSLTGLSFPACLGEAIPEITVLDFTANSLLSCQQVRDFIVQHRFPHLRRCIITDTLISPDELRVSLSKCDGFESLAQRLAIEKEDLDAQRAEEAQRVSTSLAQDALLARASGASETAVSKAEEASSRAATASTSSLAARMLQEPLLFAEDIPFEAGRKFMCRGIAFRAFNRDLLASLKRHEELFPMLTSLFISVPDGEPLSGEMLPSQIFFLNDNLIRGTLVEGKYVDGELNLSAEPFKKLPQALEDKVYEACRIIHVGDSPVTGKYDQVSGDYLYDESSKEDFLVAVFPGIYANQNCPPTHESVPSLSKNSVGIVGLTDSNELAFIWASLRDRPLGRDVRYPVLLQGGDHYCGANRVALACKYSLGNAHLIRVPLSYPGSGLGGFLRAKLHIFCEKVCETQAWRDWCSQNRARLAHLARLALRARRAKGGRGDGEGDAGDAGDAGVVGLAALTTLASLAGLPNAKVGLEVGGQGSPTAGEELDSEDSDELLAEPTGSKSGRTVTAGPAESVEASLTPGSGSAVFLQSLYERLFSANLAFESTMDGISCFCRVVSFLQNEALVPFTILDDSLRRHSSAAKCLVLMLCRAVRHVTILPASPAYFYSVYEVRVTSQQAKKASLISKVIQAVPGSEGELPEKLRAAAKAQKEAGGSAEFDLPEMDKALERLFSDLPGSDIYDGVYSIHCAYASGIAVVSSVERH